MRTIVVGVDGSDGSKDALRWALRLAERTGANIQAVHAWELSYLWIDGPAYELHRWIDQAQKAATLQLDSAVDEVAAELVLDVPVSRHVVEGLASRVLLDFAGQADLLVVGSRGRGGFAGLLLGSVSHQCVHNAVGPVTVVPPPRS